MLSYSIDNMEAEEAILRGREAHDAILNKELEEVSTLSERLTLVSKESESGPDMNAHKLIKYEL